MKKIETEILENAQLKNDGLKVPEGYFEDFAVKMAAKLPYREELDSAVGAVAKPRNSRWLQVRPYVYMAAMFAGAWCLIKMFSLMSPTPGDVNISNYPALSVALENDQFVDEYILDGVSSYDILEDTYRDSMDAETQEGEENAENEQFPPAEQSYILPGNGNNFETPSSDLQ